MWSNFHTHSVFCDGKGEMTDFIDEARRLGMISLGFSSHAPVPFECKWTMKKENLPGYLAETDKLKRETNDLEIHTSLEVDFIPGIVSPADYQARLDYTIGSIHFVDTLPDRRPWEIDGPHNTFLEGLGQIFRNDIRAAVTRYQELTREMVSTSGVTIVGHLDKIKIQNLRGDHFQESDLWYRQEILKTLDLIREVGCIVEVNTRGLYQKKSMTPYPSPWILELILEKKIPLTISSDAHYPQDLINQFAETAQLLAALGFKKLWTRREGTWQEFEFTENGFAIER